PARGRLCPSERRARHARNRSPSLSTRTISVPGLHDGAWSRRARPGCTELTADGGPRVRSHLPPAASQRTIGPSGGRSHTRSVAQQPGTPEPPGTPSQPPPDPMAPPPYEEPPRPIPIPRPDEPPVIDDPPPRRNA